MGADAVFLGCLGPELELLLPMLDERSRRLVLGAVARAAGEGGTGAVASLSGASWQTVADGAAEVASGETAAAGRVRRPGGGRRPLAESDPGLLPALEALVADSMRGDPGSPLAWTTRSVKRLAGELAAAGHPCSPVTAWRTLRRAGYTLQSNSKAAEGRQHPERDAQFRYIAAQAKEHMAAGQPVISVDAKKKEQVGNYGQDGREWRPQGSPHVVRSHDFPDPGGSHAVPYGVYDQAADAGFVNVGTDGNTAALAVESVRRWWQLAGKDAYPGATRLLVTCDAGGSNGYRNRAWKAGLAALARETGLDITVCHFPPGTSKWNKIKHRLFCQITLAWRGRPLTSYDVIISTIGAVTTATGLTCSAVLDESAYPTGLRVSDRQMREIEERQLSRHQFHGDWNYALLAVPRPAPPAPQPPPAAPSRLLSREALNQPALTGASPEAVTALAAALASRLDARLEHDLRVRHGPRTKARGAGASRRLEAADYLLATLLKRHLGVPSHVTAALLGVHDATVRHAVRVTTAILRDTRTTLPPPAQPPPARRVRTLHDLREHAAGHGITLSTPAADTPPAATLATPDTPRNHLISKRSHTGDNHARSFGTAADEASVADEADPGRGAERKLVSADLSVSLDGMGSVVTVPDVTEVAGGLRVAVGLVVRKLRQAPYAGELTLAESAALSRLERGGPATSSDLARVDRISPQSMGVTVAALLDRGLIERARDPQDGRRIVLSITEAGRRTLRDKRGARTEHIAAALRDGFSADELRHLERATALLERLAEKL